MDHCKRNSVRKSLSYWHGKSWDCLLTYWLPMKSILFLIGTIQEYQFRCNYLRSKKIFVNFMLHFWNVDEILNILTENMTLTAFAFPKVRTLKTWLDKCLRCPVSANPSPCDMVNVPKQCWNLHQSFLRKLSWEKSLLLTCKIFWLLVKTLATDEKDLFHYTNNLTIPIQMQFSQKQKTFSQFLSEFLKCRLNFEHFL